MSIDFNQYIISYKVSFIRGFKNNLNKAIQKTKEMESFDEKFKVIANNKKTLRVRNKSGLKFKKKFSLVATEQELLRDAFFPTTSIESELALKVAEASANIQFNVITRFKQSGLKNLTGGLEYAVTEFTHPFIEETIDSGVSVGIGYMPALNTWTRPYKIEYAGKGKKRHIAGFSPRESVKTYTYKGIDSVPDGNISGEGYWMFQEFGTESTGWNPERGLPNKSFFLSASAALHGEDKNEFKSIPKWINEKIDEFENKITKIIGK